MKKARKPEVPSQAKPRQDAAPAEARESRLVARLKRLRGPIAAIAAGETYQVNFTFPMRARFTGDPEGLFWSLAPASRAPHAAFLDCGDSAVVSLSPELFFTRILQSIPAEILIICRKEDCVEYDHSEIIFFRKIQKTVTAI